ncbi:hypothetical protein GCM10029963_53660 [Micromonospora andamanensis]
MDADRALRIGLVDEVLPGADLAARVEGLTGVIAERSQLSVAAAKEIVDGRADEGRMTWWHGQVRASGEAREGVAAFHERRAPRFGWTPPAGR